MQIGGKQVWCHQHPPYGTRRSFSAVRKSGRRSPEWMMGYKIDEATERQNGVAFETGLAEAAGSDAGSHDIIINTS
ncbi:unnamed protein product [Sphagnum balticum]